MKRIAWLTLVAAMLLVGTASAAYVAISGPQAVYVGNSLNVTGTSILGDGGTPSLNPGFSTEIVLYGIQHARHEVARKTIVVQQDGRFSVTFDTEGLAPGQHSVEIIDPTQTTFGSTSKTRLFVTLIDRSGDLRVDSPINQNFDGSLDLKGTIREVGKAGIQIEVKHNSATVYGPQSIATNTDGAFSTAVPISEGGTYEVTFEDARGYIDTVTFVVAGSPGPTPTPAMISASAPATRSAPAYFEVDTKSGAVMIATSAGIDWVLEYVDEDNNFRKVNDKGMVEAETAEFAAHGGTVYVKVYPMRYTDSGTVQVSASNADSVRVSQTAPTVFGDATPTPAQAAPVPAVLALLALLAVVLARRG